jgi:hypothetical protein
LCGMSTFILLSSSFSGPNHPKCAHAFASPKTSPPLSKSSLSPRNKHNIGATTQFQLFFKQKDDIHHIQKVAPNLGDQIEMNDNDNDNNIQRNSNNSNSKNQIKIEDVVSKDLQDLATQLHCMLDVNDDGKLDIQYVQLALHSILDVNGDGKLDAKDAKTALAILFMSGALLVAPPTAHAKGGGGHGGGGHSSSRSRSRSGGGSVHDKEINHISNIILFGMCDLILLGVKCYETMEELDIQRAEKKAKRRNDDFDEDFYKIAKKHTSTTSNGGYDVPQNGVYVTTSHSTDYYDDIHYQLNFDKDGSISGSSVHQTHGACFIEGEWNESKV